MMQNVSTFFKRKGKKEQVDKSKNAAKERLHLVLMQDRAHVSADFLDLMKQEIVDVIKKYIDVDENEMDVKLTKQSNDDGTSGAPALFANIPIMAIKEEAKKESIDLAKAKNDESVNSEAEAIDEKESKTKVAKTVKATATKATKKATSAKKTTTKTEKATKKIAEKVAKKTKSEEEKAKTTKKVAKTTKAVESEAVPEVNDVEEKTSKTKASATKKVATKKATTKK